MAASLRKLNQEIVDCDRCPRLRGHCSRVAHEKKRAYRNEVYWGKPVPNFGPKNRERPQMLIVGLAPAAHGANRTGRMFTGDQSGLWLYRALHRAGFASQPQSLNRDDGMRLKNVLITAVCHCAPPDNKPLPQELDHCAPFLDMTFKLLQPRLTLALGGIAWTAVLRFLKNHGASLSGDRKFTHGASARVSHGDGRISYLLGSYHPSQQNTFTGRLTEAMFDSIFEKSREILAKSLNRI